MQEKLQELQSKLSDEELEKNQLLKQLTEAQKKFEGQLRLEEVLVKKTDLGGEILFCSYADDVELVCF